MRPTMIRTILLGFVVMFGFAQPTAWAVGLLPTPTLQGVHTQATVTFDSSTQVYDYVYTVTNPGSNSGEIWRIVIDIRTNSPSSFTPPFDASGLTIRGGASSLSFFDALETVSPLELPPGQFVVAFGQQGPNGWAGGLNKAGTAYFYSMTGTPNIAPGSTLGGFHLQSRGFPTIRPLHLSPYWILQLNTEDDLTPQLEQEAKQTRESITFRTFTLAPSGMSAGSYGHWNQLRDDLTQAIQLGWIPDVTFANTLVSQLASARQALDALDGTLAKSRLTLLLQAMAASSPTQRRDEVATLIQISGTQLREATLDTPVPFEPQVTLTPTTKDLAIGVSHTVTAKVVNAALPTRPVVPGYQLMFRITDGPNSGRRFEGATDGQGQLLFTFTSQRVGTDRVSVGIPAGEGSIEEHFSAFVTWTGGPDLVVPFFVPPILETGGGRQVHITEWTGNIGTAATPPSITRYYVSATRAIDPFTARVLGERSVPALQAGETSKGVTATFTLPSDLPAGTYYLAACADAPERVTELVEENNCSFNEISNSVSIVPHVGSFGTPNNPPVCSKAVASPPTLWPPNHKLETVSVQGVQDPDRDPIQITIQGITQDEPVNGLGDGDTAPDGFGVGNHQAQVRRERAGNGNGRVYHLSFEATDGHGGSCTGRVTVGVPHDQGQGNKAIDDGQRFDSTLQP